MTEARVSRLALGNSCDIGMPQNVQSSASPPNFVDLNMAYLGVDKT